MHVAIELVCGCWHAQRAQWEPQSADRVAEGVGAAATVKAAQELLLAW